MEMYKDGVRVKWKAEADKGLEKEKAWKTFDIPDSSLELDCLGFRKWTNQGIK